MKATNITFSILLISVVLIGVNAIDQIWLSPRNVSVMLSSPLYFDSDLVPKGEWVSLDNGINPRTSAAVEIDSKGLIWLLGGSAMDFFVNTVWNYDPKTDQYRWVAGRPDIKDGGYTVYGDFGVPSADAYPGPFQIVAHTIDKDDNIWLYGGEQIPRYDFWRFNTTSFEFTYFSLANSSAAGPIMVTEKGVPSRYNFPGSIQGGTLHVDSLNNLWLVGGTNDSSYLQNAIWHFNTTSFMWSWMWGSLSSTENVDFANNYYNGRWSAGGFIDSEDRIWMFGGMGTGPDGDNDWNDIWSFDTKTLQWRVEWGSMDSYVASSTIVSDDFNIGNFPSSRSVAQLVDRRDGTLMIVGGYVYTGATLLNDIWLFNKTSKMWKMVYGVSSGEAVATSYTNYHEPGSLLGTRAYYGAPSGPNTRGNYIMFAGSNNVGSALNDIWIIPQDPCVMCDVNANCTSADMWSYTCTCKEGYNGNGETCTPDAVPVAPVAVPVAAPVSGNNGPVAKTPQSKTTSGASTLVSFGVTILSLIVVVVN